MRWKFREPPACHFGKVLFIIVSLLPKTSNERAELLKKFHEYASFEVKNSAGPLRGSSSIQARASRRFAPNPCAARPGTPLDRLPGDGGRANPSQGGLHDHPLGFERTTIQERRYSHPLF